MYTLCNILLVSTTMVLAALTLLMHMYVAQTRLPNKPVPTDGQTPPLHRPNRWLHNRKVISTLYNLVLELAYPDLSMSISFFFYERLGADLYLDNVSTSKLQFKVLG